MQKLRGLSCQPHYYWRRKSLKHSSPFNFPLCIVYGIGPVLQRYAKRFVPIGWSNEIQIEKEDNRTAASSEIGLINTALYMPPSMITALFRAVHGATSPAAEIIVCAPSARKIGCSDNRTKCWWKTYFAREARLAAPKKAIHAIKTIYTV